MEVLLVVPVVVAHLEAVEVLAVAAVLQVILKILVILHHKLKNYKEKLV
jgi:hypothetical protein